jgi:hypothetical protein
MRTWWIVVASLLGLATVWLAGHSALSARTAGDLIAVGLVLFWLSLPWVGLVLTARTAFPSRRERRPLSRR